MRRQPGALRPQRLLRHLDDDLLPFFQQFFDLGLGSLVAIAVTTTAIATGAVRLVDAAGRIAAIAGGAQAAARRRRRRMFLVVGVQALELFEAGDDVADVEKAVAFEAEVNESRLHAGQHFGYPALVHVAHHAARALALDEDLGNLIVLEDRDPRFVGARGDDHLLAHARNSERVVAAALGGLLLRAPSGTSAGPQAAE